VIADIRTSSLILLPGEKLKFNIYLDRSVIEVFANDRLAMATRIYPTRTDSFGLDIASGNLESLEVWEMESINI
jgi:sucrose-6-phosphate hydrolase SacC (GH32 family)